MKQIISRRLLLLKWPADAAYLITPMGSIRTMPALERLCNTYIDSMSWSLECTFMDPKGYRICTIEDLFSDLPFEWEDDATTSKIDLTKLCMPHKRACQPMQRCDEIGQSKFWIYCKECGDWLYPAAVPANGGK